MRKLGIAIVTAYLLLCLGLAALADELFGLSTTPWFHFAAIGLLLPAVLPAWRERLAQIGALVYVGVLVLLPFVACTPRKPFCQFYLALRDGMTPADVRGELVRRFPADGRFARPTEIAGGESLCFQLDPNDGAYNAELVVLKVADGRVVSKKYLPD